MFVPDTILRSELLGSTQPKYRAIAQAIRNAIVSEQLAAGERLPTVREMAYRIGVTPGTVARAYSTLIEEGRLVAGVGRGTYVSGAEPPRSHRGPTFPSFRNAPSEDISGVNLISPRMPEFGQDRLIRDGMRQMADSVSVEDTLLYPDRETDFAARKAFSESLDPAHIGPFSVDQIVSSHGGQSAIVMILQTVLHGTSPVIAVDELSYGGFRSAAMLTRAGVIGVPWDDDGPDPQIFEELARSGRIQVFCTSAEVCNPTVKTTAPQRRIEIAGIAERYGIHIIDDNCYRLSRSGPSYRSFLPNLAWHVCSPSKSLTAALRIGFTVAPEDWYNSLARTAKFGFFGVSRVLTDLYAYLQGHPETPGITAAITDRFSQDIHAGVNVLGRNTVNWSKEVPFLWLLLPNGWRAGEFTQAAAERGIQVRSAEDFSLRDSRTVHAVRIAVNGQIPHERFKDAMTGLCHLLDNPPLRVPD